MPRAVDGVTQQAIDHLQSLIDADPEIQYLLSQNADRIKATHDQGGSARSFQNSLRDKITNIAKRNGYVPKEGQYFINPNDGQLEPHGGWAGLSKKTKGAIIAASIAAGGIGLAVAGGGLGAGAGAAATAANASAAPDLGATLLGGGFGAATGGAGGTLAGIGGVSLPAAAAATGTAAGTTAATGLTRKAMGNLSSSTWLPAAINAASNIGVGLLADDPDPAHPNVPFTGLGDPNMLMQEFVKGLTGYGRAATDLARSPVSLPSSFVQPVAGTTGVDPAFADRSLLTMPGLDLPDLFPNFGTPTDTTKKPAALGPSEGPAAVDSGERDRGDNPVIGQSMPRPGTVPPPTTSPAAAQGLTRRAPSAPVPLSATGNATLPNEAAAADPMAAAAPTPGLAAESGLRRRLASNSPLAANRQAEGAVRLLMELYNGKQGVAA